MNIKRYRFVFLFILITILIFGYFKFSKPEDEKFIGYYDNVHGLQKSAPVYYFGVLIGRVYDVTIEKNGKVRVVFSIHKNMKINEGTTARVTSDPLKGGMAVIFKPGTGKSLTSNSEIQTVVDSSLTDQFHAKVSPMIKKGEKYLTKIDSSLYKIIDITDTNCSKGVQRKILELHEKIGGLSSRINNLKKQTKDFAQTIKVANKNSSKILENSKEISKRIELSVLSSSLKTKIPSMEKVQAELLELKDKLAKINSKKTIKNSIEYRDVAHKIDSINKQLENFKQKR